jgi:thiol-disulfide isomerase/thioredoxin
MSSLFLLLLNIACVPVLTSPKDSADESCWQTADNDWISATPRADLESTGFGLGEIPPDMCMLDQHGNNVSLWQFYGQVILLDISAEWCAPCQELATEVDHTWKDYEDQGFMYLTILAEDNASQIPNQEVLEQWATDFEITAPVLSDSEGYRSKLVPTGAYPRLMLIDRTMKVSVDNVTPANDENIRAKIEEAL